MKGRREKENVTKSTEKRMLRKQEEEAENGKMRILRNGEKQREGIERVRKEKKQRENTIESMDRVREEKRSKGESRGSSSSQTVSG